MPQRHAAARDRERFDGTSKTAFFVFFFGEKPARYGCTSIRFILMHWCICSYLSRVCVRLCVSAFNMPHWNSVLMAGECSCKRAAYIRHWPLLNEIRENVSPHCKFSVVTRFAYSFIFFFLSLQIFFRFSVNRTSASATPGHKLPKSSWYIQTTL